MIAFAGGRLCTVGGTLLWAGDALLEETPSSTVVFAWRGAVLLRQGVISKPRPSSSPDIGVRIGQGPIAQKAATAAVELSDPAVYLPALQILPGRVEFTANGVIPSNTQSLVVISVGRHGTLLLAADRARAFTPKDIDTAVTLSQPLALVLENSDGES